MSVTAAICRIITAALLVAILVLLCQKGASAQEIAGADINMPQQQPGGGIGARLANLPGAKTASGILASSADGLARYFAPDGPIQPALTAIGGLPMRGIEYANKGISRMSQGFDSSAKNFANSAGNDGTIRMPGMDAMESSMPASFAHLGGMMHGAIQQKNKFIMGQAEKGIQAGGRLHSMMQGGLQSMASGGGSQHMGKAAMDMMGSAQHAVMKSTETITHHVKKSLDGKMGRMHGVMAMGGNMVTQAQGLVGTLAEGLQSSVSELHKTGGKVRQQLKGGMHDQGKMMSGIVSSKHSSMMNVGHTMQKGLQGVMKSAQQVSSQLQQAVSGKLEMVKSVGSKMGSMMMMPMSHGGHSSSHGGGY